MFFFLAPSFNILCCNSPPPENGRHDGTWLAGANKIYKSMRGANKPNPATLKKEDYVGAGCIKATPPSHPCNGSKVATAPGMVP